MTTKNDAAVVALALIIERCVDAGNNQPHASAMIAFYFGARAEQIAPDFAEALRNAFDRTFQVTSGEPGERVEEQFRTVIEDMAMYWRKVP